MVPRLCPPPHVWGTLTVPMTTLRQQKQVFVLHEHLRDRPPTLCRRLPYSPTAAVSCHHTLFLKIRLHTHTEYKSTLILLRGRLSHVHPVKCHVSKGGENPQHQIPEGLPHAPQEEKATADGKGHRGTRDGAVSGLHGEHEP